MKRTVLKVLNKLGTAAAPYVKEPLPLLKDPLVEVRSIAAAALDLRGNNSLRHA